LVEFLNEQLKINKMFKNFAPIVSILFIAVLPACSKKTTPMRTTPETPININVPDTVKAIDTTAAILVKTDTVAAVKKAPVKRKIKVPVPQVISVNDNAAKRSVDGRLYYDLQGHRYWRNNKDGKYYLYNKSMNTDPDFKNP
jgi:hypothetical protein